MVCRLIDFAFVVLKSLMFKVCGIIGISRIELFNYSGNERVKVIRGLQALEVLNFQSPGILKGLQYIESPSQV